MSTYRTSGNARPHEVAPDPGRTKNDGCKLVTQGQPFKLELGLSAYMIAGTALVVGYILGASL